MFANRHGAVQLSWFIKFSLLLALLNATCLSAEHLSAEQLSAEVAGEANKEAPLFVQFETNHGNLLVELYPEKAPANVANFLRYVDAGLYDDSIIYRIEPGFVVQGGPVATDGQNRPLFPAVVNESANGLKHQYGALGVGRYADPDSATGHYYFSMGPAPHLDYHTVEQGADQVGYTIFGQLLTEAPAAVPASHSVLEAIAAEPVQAQGVYQHMPKQAVIVHQVSRVSRSLD